MLLKNNILRLSLCMILLLVLAVVSVSLAQDEAPAASDEGQSETKQTEKMSMLDLLLKGRWFMVPLGLCSLMGLTIIIERLIALRRNAVIPPNFMDGLKAVFRRGQQDRSAGLQYCKSNPCPLASVVAAGIRRMSRGQEAVEKAIEDAGANEVSKLRRNLRLLFGVAAVSPMLGLLGTVWGMIQAFQVASQAGLGQAGMLATGIYEALVTTFAGLSIAIPTLIFYYYFQGKIDYIVHEMNETSVEFVEHYTGDKIEPAASVPAEAPANAAAATA